jgi:hypothetical protein
MNFKQITLALAATLSMGAVQAQSLVLSPSTKSVELGDTFTLQVEGKGFASRRHHQQRIGHLDGCRLHDLRQPQGR